METRRIRAFCALTLDDDAIDASSSFLASPHAELDGFRWVPRENLHITLKFFGAITENEIEEISKVLHTCAEEAIPATLGTLGSFPELGAPKVLWLGVADPTGALRALHSRIETRCAALGFKKETRSYTPHLTVARSRKTRNAIEPSIVTEVEKAGTHDTLLGNLVLFESTLTPNGPIYRPLQDFKLGVHGLSE